MTNTPNQKLNSMDALTATVIERMSEAPNPRFKQLMTALVTKLHELVREVDLTPEEWFKTIEFLTATGQACKDMRQEFILLSDTIGVSMMTVILDQARSTKKISGALAATEATEATVQGPYYWEGAPQVSLGDNIAEGVKGEPTFYSGRVTDLNGKPISGALLDLWSGDGDGNYDMQVEGSEMAARGQLKTDENGKYWYWSIRPSYYPVPMDGPVGRMLEQMGRHPNRPGHIHMKVSAPGYEMVTTHLFVANSPFIDSDAVFGVRQSLIVEYKKAPAGTAPDGRVMPDSYWTAVYDFALVPSES